MGAQAVAPDRRDPKGHKVRRDLPARIARCQDRKGQPVLKATRDQRAPTARYRVRRDRKATRDRKANRGQPVHKVSRALKDRRGRPGSRARSAPKATLGSKVCKVTRDR